MDWAHRFLLSCGDRPAEGLGTAEVEGFLTSLAAERGVSASTQNQALNALVFLFKEVLDRPLEDLGFARARRPRRLPVVLTREEVRVLLQQMSGVAQLMAGLMYGSGMRLMECMRLRVKDVDFGQRLMVVRDGKGAKDRVVPLPERYLEALGKHLVEVRRMHEQDLAREAGASTSPVRSPARANASLEANIPGA